jgi:hypothetical protein
MDRPAYNAAILAHAENRLPQQWWTAADLNLSIQIGTARALGTPVHGRKASVTAAAADLAADQLRALLLDGYATDADLPPVVPARPDTRRAHRPRA